MVPPAGPGVFTAKPSGPGIFKLVVTGHTYTSRGEIEKYLAYRAARLTIEQGGEWFTFTEDRGKGETAEPAPAHDSEGPRYSFRMKYFRPVWRYKTSGSQAWTRWSPFAGVPSAKLRNRAARAAQDYLAGSAHYANPCSTAKRVAAARFSTPSLL